MTKEQILAMLDQLTEITRKTGGRAFSLVNDCNDIIEVRKILAAMRGKIDADGLKVPAPEPAPEPTPLP